MADPEVTVVSDLQIAKLDLKAGDILVVRVTSQREWNMATRATILRHFAPILPPKTKIAIIGPDMELAVLRPENVETV